MGQQGGEAIFKSSLFGRTASDVAIIEPKFEGKSTVAVQDSEHNVEDRSGGKRVGPLEHSR